MAGIKLTKGQVAIVDDSDVALLSRYNWCADKIGKTWYAKSRFGGRVHYMHRLLMGEPPGRLIDHRDGDGLNNRRSNLREATHSTNLANSRGPEARGKSSRFKGVSLNHNRNWSARIMVRYKGTHLGVYPSEEAAAKAYDCAARHYFGEFAKLNFPVTT
jgi:hypothetical protein